MLFIEEYDRYLNLLYVREVNFGEKKVHGHRGNIFLKNFQLQTSTCRHRYDFHLELKFHFPIFKNGSDVIEVSAEEHPRQGSTDQSILDRILGQSAFITIDP